MDDLLVYGSYGYTGDLIAREAVSRGETPILAGRDRRRLTEQATELEWDPRPFALDDSDLADRLSDVEAVLNCAGPFEDTAEPLVEACIESDTDYLDITGEYGVFERLAGEGDRAADADVTLLPGVGFDVVPSDCLAAFLHEQLPAANRLSLGIAGLDSPSRGTARTMVRSLGEGGVVRRDGQLVRVPSAYRTREIDFGRGPTTAVTIPWGDVSTAYHSTGIGNVEVYMAVPGLAVPFVRLGDSLGGLLGSAPVADVLERLVDATIDGPDERQRARNRAVVWGEAVVDDADEPDRTGDRVVARLGTPNPYALTADSALAAAERVLDGDAETGFQTPSSAFGADFALELDGVERELVEATGR